MPTTPRALIIGGGIGGLCAGIALRRAGWDATVFERAPAFRPVGAGLTLWGNAVRALDALGVGDAVRAGGRPGGGGGFYTWRGRPLSVLSAADVERIGGAPSVAVHRADLIDLLLDALGRDVVRTGMQCLEATPVDGGAIARFAGGGVERGDLLVGADGLNSVVRAGLFGAAPPTYAGYVAWRGVCDFDTAGMPIGEHLGRGERFGLVPLRGVRLYWFAVANAPANDAPPPDARADLLRRFGHWGAPIPDVIRRTDPAAILRTEIADRDPLRRWGDGPITLLGDAAHPMTPNLGQGACQAIEDAVELGRTVGPVRDAADVPAACRAYEARRIPRTTRIVLLSRKYGRLAQGERPLACWLRDRLMAWTPRGVQVRQLAGILNWS